MTNKEAAEILNEEWKINAELFGKQFNDALGLAIKALMRFRHVIIIHPKYGECDGWYDEERHLLFHDFVTKEIADRYGWKIKEVEE